MKSVKKFEIELSSKCNAKCPGCLRTILNERNVPFANRHLNVDVFFSRFQSSTFSDMVVKLCGVLGDPMAHPRILEFVEFLLEKEAVVEISTNASLGAKNVWEALATLSADTQRLFVNFSVDGLGEVNQLYRVNTDFSKILQNMELFSQKGGKGQWFFIEFPHNIHQKKEVIALADSMGFPFFSRRAIRNSMNIHKGGRVSQNAAAVRSETQHQELSAAVEVMNKPQVTLSPKEVLCKHQEEGELFLSADGRLWPCCFLWDEYNSDRSTISTKMDRRFAGSDWNSLNEYSVEEILDHDFFQDLQRMWEPEDEYFTKRCYRSCGARGKLRNQQAKEVL